MKTDNISIDESCPPGIFIGQIIHFVSLVFLLVLCHFTWTTAGKDFPFLFWSAIAVPMLHQLYVWVCWRLELKSQAVSNSIGFNIYLFLFFLFLVGRPATVLGLSIAGMNTMGIPPIARIVLPLLCVCLAGYTFISIVKYFGLARAAGADHFFEDYRKMLMVDKGIFKYTSNAMYIFGFLILWALAIAFDSETALIAAAFNHVYIWIHYFTVEKPDMQYLYDDENN